MRTRTALSSALGIAAILPLSWMSPAWAQTPGGDVAQALVASPAIAGPPPPPAYAPPLQPPFSGPVVILRASRPKARLQQQLELRWKEVCIAPCGVPVDPAGLYRVGGSTFRGSEPFRIPRSSGQVVVEAHVGSSIGHWVGLGMTIIGGVAFLGGASLIAFKPGRDPTAQRYLTGLGVGSAVGGVVLLAVGIPLLVSSGTSVEVQ